MPFAYLPLCQAPGQQLRICCEQETKELTLPALTEPTVPRGHRRGTKNEPRHPQNCFHLRKDRNRARERAARWWQDLLEGCQVVARAGVSQGQQSEALELEVREDGGVRLCGAVWTRVKSQAIS